MPIVLLVRHGENDYVKTGRLAGRTPGVHLNDSGREQAQKTAAVLKGAPVKAIYSSPMERAMETAEPLAQVLELPINVREGLLETDIGEWQGRTVKSLQRLKLWKVVQQAPSRLRFPGGESFAEIQFRICQEIEKICTQHEPKDLVVCVSHADPIKLAVAYFLGMPLDSFQRLVIAPASITGLAIGETSSQLIMLNYYPALNFPKP
jgi:probable phosphomutase (TIGR03848 family)